MTIREKLDKFKPFFESLCKLINETFNTHYELFIDGMGYITKYKSTDYISVIENNAPCLIFPLETDLNILRKLEPYQLPNETDIHKLLKQENIDNIKFEFVKELGLNGKIVFVIPINLEDY